MAVMTVTLDDDVEARLRKVAHGKGALGSIISNATKNWLDAQEQAGLKQKGLSLLKGWPMGKILVKSREDVHAR